MSDLLLFAGPVLITMAFILEAVRERRRARREHQEDVFNAVFENRSDPTEAFNAARAVTHKYGLTVRDLDRAWSKARAVHFPLERPIFLIDTSVLLSVGSENPLAQRARNVFGFASAMLPTRTSNEELGDALEDVQRRIAAGRPAYEVNAKIAASVLWAILHTLQYELKRTLRAFRGLLGKWGSS